MRKKFTITEDTRIPGTNILLEKGDKIYVKEAVEVYRPQFTKKPEDTWETKDENFLVYHGEDDYLYIYQKDSYGDYYDSNAYEYNSVKEIRFSKDDYDVIYK